MIKYYKFALERIVWIWSCITQEQSLGWCRLSNLGDDDSFSSPEAAILLVCARNRDLWPLPISEHAQSTRSVVFSQSDLLDFTMSP